MIRFEKLFLRHILSRGYDYYVDDLVQDLEINDNVIHAIVNGTDTYKVKIIIKDNDIEDMECSCPYFQEGNNCKHLVAVVYAASDVLFVNEYEDEEEPEDLFELDDGYENYIEILEKAPKEELYNFLKEELENNGKLRLKFIAKLQKYSSIDSVYYIDRINDVFDEHLYDDEFISYNQIPDFENDLEVLISIINSLVKNEDFIIAFDMIKHMAYRMSTVELDDSMGTISSIIGDLVNMLGEIILKASEELNTKIFEWICIAVSDVEFGYLGTSLEKTFINYFNDAEKLKRKIVIVDEIICELEKEKDWSWGYRLTGWIINKIELLEKLEDNNEINEILEHYIDLSKIRDIKINRLISNNEYQQAIDLLIEGKERFHDMRGIVYNYSTKLIEVYGLIGNREKVLEESKNRILSYSPSSLEAYLGYKKLFSSKDWEKERSIILDQLKTKRCDIKVYYAEEELLDELFLEIKSSSNFDGLDLYEKQLKKKYASELLELHKLRLLKLIQNSGGRKHYRHIVSRLKHLKKYDMGNDLISSLVQSWCIQYKNRPAMIDEFKKAKLL